MLSLCVGRIVGGIIIEALVGKTAGRNVDDVVMTAEVKMKRATGPEAVMLTKIDVETNCGTVALQRTLDLPSQVEQHPWLMFGGALLVGYMLGSRGGGRTLREMFKQAMPTLALHIESALTE